MAKAKKTKPEVELKTAALAVEVYQVVRDNTDSFEVNHIGSDLAYLLGAILNDSRCDWPEGRQLVVLLRKQFGKRHPVWKYIYLDSDEDA